MIHLLNIEKAIKNLVPVTSSEYTIGKSNAFHPEGLFSEVIFGAKDSPQRNSTYSYVNLNCRVLHPALYAILQRLNRKILLAIERKASYSLDETGFLEENDEGEINGITSIYKNFEKIISVRKEVGQRLDMQRMVLKYFKDDMAFINYCLVIPAGYRDAMIDEIRGGLRINPINEYYVKIIRSSIQLQLLSVKEGAIYEIVSAKMMYLVKDLYDYILEKISKKQGLVRQDVLGKRADFTGRAVITGAGTEVKIDEIGIPFKILVKLFEPFVLYDIVNSKNTDKVVFSELLQKYNNSTLSVPAIRSLISEIQKGHELPKDLETMMQSSVVRAIKDKVVLAKRDPALHSESVQGFKPVMTSGDTIRINAAKCSGFNADFDGDQMAVYVPVTKESIEECKKLMISSQSKDSINALSDDFSKDVVAGIYALTRDPATKKSPITIKNDDELEQLDPTTIIRYDGNVTTVGRVIFNNILPSKKYHIDWVLTRKMINSLAEKIYKDYGEEDPTKYVTFCHNLLLLGMKYYSICGISFSLDDLKIPESINNLKKKLETANTEDADKITRQMQSILTTEYSKKDSGLSILVNSGASKGVGQLQQIVASKGLFQSIEGEVVKPIASSYSDGFTSKQYFDSGVGSRAGIVDRVINTSDTGYFSRQLVYALQRVEADPSIKDCKTKRFFVLKVTDDIAKRLNGRYILNSDGNIVSFNKSYIGKVIHLRSPMYCLSKRLCRTCYGDLLLRNKTHYVGILAGEIFGEVLTQAIMRTFHVGGAVSIKNINIMDELTKIMEDGEKLHFLKSFVQEGQQLKSLTNGELIIELESYKDPKKDIELLEDVLRLNYAYFKINYLSYSVDVMIDNKIEIDLKDKVVDEADGVIKVLFNKNSNVFICTPTSEVFTEKVKMIQTMLSGRAPWKNANHFCMKIYDLYYDLATKADLVHFEVLASNLLRDKGNPSYPARLNPKYNPVVGSIKKIPPLESWLQSFAFENPNQAISVGLLYNRPTDETILEKIITGNFDF